ncbi:MAG: site-specific DNA-methyltransferase [Pseudomonadota bacterium]|nr:site-specific DNA-methyltransferase [Pseudomonadota bacterium]
MPSLDWIGKPAVVGHHREVPYLLTTADGRFAAGDVDSGNILVQGDNLTALKALLPRYGGRVRCIYIDPPYNTGNEGWVYNDNVSHPEIVKWLGKLVGKEAEDLSRHDKWLCMMYPRLSLLREFLTPDGVIFISIGSDEVGNLRVICDEIFGPRNLIEMFIWQIEGNTENQEDITSVHEYVLAYSRNPEKPKIGRVIDPNVAEDSKLFRDFAENSIIKNGDTNPASIIELPAGFKCSVDTLYLAAHPFAAAFVAKVESRKDRDISRDMKADYDNVNYPVRLDDMVVEDGVLVKPCRVYSGWSSANKIRNFIQGGFAPLVEADGSRLHFYVSHTGVPTYRREDRKGHFVPTILRNMGTTETASNTLERMGVDFDYPKPVRLIEHLLSLYTKPGDIVMDSFCGSGTTGQAALKLNREKDMGLRFILVELDTHVAENVAAKRLKSVIEGYTERRNGKKASPVPIPGLGGGLQFLRLAQPLMHESGRVNDGVTFADLASHVYFAVTGRPLPEGTTAERPLVGVLEGVAVYLLFNEPEAGIPAILNSQTLRSLPPHEGPRVVWADGTTLSEARLQRENVSFRQLPYDLKVG